MTGRSGPRTREELRYYLAADLAALGHDRRPRGAALFHPIVHFQGLLRRVEYLDRRSDPISRVVVSAHKLRLLRLGQRLGLTIPRGVFGPGLAIVHYGSVTVNPNATVGGNCRLHSDVVIGSKRGRSPVIGNDVWIGAGAKVFGRVTVGDGAVIGANAVVDSDVPEHTVVVGVPARVVRAVAEHDPRPIDGCGVADARRSRSRLRR